MDTDSSATSEMMDSKIVLKQRKPLETEEDVDEMVKVGMVKPSMAKLMKSSIRRKAASKTKSKPAETEEDVDEMVKVGMVKPSMAKLMKSSIRRKAASKTKSKPAETEEDVDEMVKVGMVKPSMAKLMKSSIRRKADSKSSAETFSGKGTIKFIDSEKQYGYIDIMGSDDVHFRFANCYENPRYGETVKVTYIKYRKGKFTGKLSATHVAKFSPKTMKDKGEISKFIPGKEGKKGYGYIITSHTSNICFQEKNCYANPKYKDMVEVEYIKATKHGKPKFHATRVTKDVTGMELRAAAAAIYDLTDGAISVDSRLYSDDPGAMTEVLSVAKKMTAEYRMKRRKAIGRAYGALKHAQNVQIAFLMDCTGSMASHLKAANKGIEEIVSTVKSKLPSANVHFAFIGYRDFDMPGIIKLEFTQDTEAFKAKVFGGLADGGGDEAEDVQSGLEALDALNWDLKIPSKLCFFIADAPCHGRYFAGKTDYNDNKPYFDSDGSKAQCVLHSIYKKGIKITHLRINNRTADMIRTYNQLLASSVDGNEEYKVLVHPISEARDIIDAAIATTVASVSAATNNASVSLASTGKSHRLSHLTRLKKEILKRETRLKKIRDPESLETSFKSFKRSSDGRASALSDIKEETRSDMREESSETSATSFISIGQSVKDKPGAQLVAVFCCSQPTSMSEIKRLGSIQPPKARQLVIEDSEFDKGGVRKVQLATDVTFEPTKYAFKTYIKPKSEYEEEIAVKQDLQTQAVASFLAQKFSALPEIKKKIVYLKSKGVEFRDNTGARRFASIERFLEGGGYEKWCNNAGYARKADDPDFSATLDTFSHWTYEATNKHLIVVDVQGIKSNESTFVLTDPGIHCVNETRYGDTNFSDAGFNMFFETHRCNQLCKALRLKNRSGKATITKGTGLVG